MSIDQGPTLRLSGRWLLADFPAPQRTVSWAVANGGSRLASTVGWYFVERDELRFVRSPVRHLRSRMRVEGLENAVGMMTARRLHAYVEECTQSGKYCCRVILTAGLSNALRVGDPASRAPAAGTINILCWLSTPLDSHASMEALALVAEARTAAMLESGALSIVSGTPATGTGTDCIVVASPAERRRLRYVGKHLIFGQLIGASVYNAMRRAVAEWHSEYSRAASEVQEISFATPPGR